MNPHMLEAAPVQRNLAQLASDGWNVMQPGAGLVACGDVGAGRLPEPAEIMAWVQRVLGP
jgi:phosphopantothenoylcysteine decarboxylase/phosphopantothenate--cysteine ligase